MTCACGGSMYFVTSWTDENGRRWESYACSKCGTVQTYCVA